MWLRDTPVANDAAIFLCVFTSVVFVSVLWWVCGKWRWELRGFEARQRLVMHCWGSLGMCGM